MQAQAPRGGHQAQATFDLTQESAWNSNHWVAADALDADSAHSRFVRHQAVIRSRHETANNGYVRGILKTYADYFCGDGPKLRVQTGNKTFNALVERLWKDWFRATRFALKLWTMTHARVQDGEAFGLVGYNPRLPTRVKLDVRLIETEQVQTPLLTYFDRNHIDGLVLDAFGNPSLYDVLPEHPGRLGFMHSYFNPIPTPAEYVLHWFHGTRPGQHRGMPELSSTLGGPGAAYRRMREATLNAAETAADFTLVLNTDMLPEEDELVAPFTTANINKGMIAALPWQTQATQLKAEHPNTQYGEFMKANVAELGRPLGMPYNVSAADSSGANLASSKLDMQGLFQGIDVDRVGAELMVLSKMFGLWWAEAVGEYAFNARADKPLPHTWDWPQQQPTDARGQAIFNERGLKTGSITIPQIFADAGYDAEEEAQKAADFFGISSQDYKQRLFDTLLPGRTDSGGADGGDEDATSQIDQIEEDERQQELEEAGAR